MANGESSLAAPVISGSVLGSPFSDLFNNLTEINLRDGAKLTLYVDYVLLFCSGGFRGSKVGCKCTPLWQLVMYFCINKCTSPSNDYTAVECSNNNQAQLHTHVSAPY